MKKALLIIAILFLVFAGASAESPDTFAFEIQTGASWAPGTGSVSSLMSFGFAYSFNETFSAGFNFYSNPSAFSLLHMGVNLGDMQFRLYSGIHYGDIAYGLGFGYDFFSRKDTIFASLGLYVDWLATAGSPFSVSDGGLLTIGLKTKLGL